MNSVMTTAVIPNDGTIPQNCEGAVVSVLTEIEPDVIGVEFHFTSYLDDKGYVTAAVFFDSDYDAVSVCVNHHNRRKLTLSSPKRIVLFGGRKPYRVELRIGSDRSIVELSNVSLISIESK